MHTSRRTALRHLAVASAVCLLAAGCGGAKSDESGSPGGTGGGAGGGGWERPVNGFELGSAEAGEPQRGGKLVYGVEAESAAGFCLSEAQLAISGMMVVRAFYDTLTVPNAEGGYSPYLARSVTPNDDHTEWDIVLRDGIRFHDGSPLTAEVVKNNLDAYRGRYEGRPSTLFLFVLSDIAETSVVDPLTVRVTTTRPWVSLPAFLFASSRLGIMAQAQLDADGAACADRPIGTGPFEFESWTVNQKLTGKRNASYWQIAPDGEPFPYVDEIEFRPMPDNTVRLNSLRSGEIDITHDGEGNKIVGPFADMVESGDANMVFSDAQAELGFMMLNHRIAPFDDVRIRTAMAHATDREELTQRLHSGVQEVATGVFGEDSIGYLEDAGYPGHDVEAAKELVAEYVAEGKDPSFTLLSTSDPITRTDAEGYQQRAAAVGITVRLQTVAQATLIENAIGGSYQAMLFRNYPGGEPDQNHVWWYGEGNPVNFGGWDDPELNALLDRGRETADPDQRRQIYQDVNRIMTSQVFALWTTFTPWVIVTAGNVHGVLGPPLPGEDHTVPVEAEVDDPGRKPNAGLATGHSLLGLWVSQ